MALVRYGYNESSIFRYAFSNIDTTISLLKSRFKNIFLFKNLMPLNKAMIYDKHHNISFHTEIKSRMNKATKEWEFILPTDERYEVYLSEKAKITYLIEKLFLCIDNNNKILYFIKDPSFLEEDKLLRLIDVIKSLGNDNFNIHYISLKKWQNRCTKYNSIKHLSVSFVNYYAPDENAEKFDETQYINIFSNNNVTKNILKDIKNEK